jgi:hypothetical protein
MESRMKGNRSGAAIIIGKAKNDLGVDLDDFIGQD